MSDRPIGYFCQRSSTRRTPCNACPIDTIVRPSHRAQGFEGVKKERQDPQVGKSQLEKRKGLGFRGNEAAKGGRQNYCLGTICADFMEGPDLGEGIRPEDRYWRILRSPLLRVPILRPSGIRSGGMLQQG